MIPELPRPDLPAWLAGDHIGQGVIPIDALLEDSVYYPACGVDGQPVECLGGDFYSFVYVNYGEGRERLLHDFERVPFKGYDLLFRRDVREEELTPRGWTPIPPKPSDGNPERPMEHNWIRPPFTIWAVLDRLPGFGEDHGPERFSLLYIGADGAAAFQALYHGNRTAPAVVAIIQPGTGFGGNWTDFREPGQVFGRSVLRNPYGTPRYLLYGGWGPPDGYSEPCWPQYARRVRQLAPCLHLWARPDA